jgi:hypothetical protein
MKQLHILLFFISLFFNVVANSQQKIDTVTFKESYGLRIGADILKPGISLFDNKNKGIELTGDVRFYKNYYAAVELGFENKTSTEEYLNFTTKGSFVKVGINYNAYQNWKGMANEIFVGARYGFSFFNQTLNNYIPNIKGTYFTTNQIASGTEFKDLNAHWIEFVAGMKVETLKNLYLGTQISVKKMISTKEPSNFKNLYAPGFNRIYLNNMGIGFNYTISYLIPIIRKNN